MAPKTLKPIGRVRRHWSNHFFGERIEGKNQWQWENSDKGIPLQTNLTYSRDALTPSSQNQQQAGPIPMAQYCRQLFHLYRCLPPRGRRTICNTNKQATSTYIYLVTVTVRLLEKSIHLHYYGKQVDGTSIFSNRSLPLVRWWYLMLTGVSS